MPEFAWPWIALLLPLPWLLRRWWRAAAPGMALHLPQPGVNLGTVADRVKAGAPFERLERLFEERHSTILPQRRFIRGAVDRAFEDACEHKPERHFLIAARLVERIVHQRDAFERIARRVGAE